MSIQGEGTRTGELCVFLRTHGCSFDCSYCDTKYAVFEEPQEYHPDDLVDIVKDFGVNLVEITGGEPLEQKETPLLAKKLLDAGFEVLIETNGAYDISVLPKEVVKIMDVKLPWASLNIQQLNFYYENLKHLTEKDEVKFVIDNEKGYDWAKNFIATYKIPCKVIFSPCAEGISPQELADKIISDKLPVRLGLQIHKYIWGDQRGV